ncbi:MAG: bifunctional nuclease family protein [Desulfovibrionaceae bacterium]
MIAMHVIGLSIDENNQSPMVVLRDDSGQHLLSVWLGSLEAIAIGLGISGTTLPRPLTHDLLLNVLQSCGASLSSVAITHAHEGVYYAHLSLRHGTHDMELDCRPSDAITLAVRLGVPIYVSDTLLQKNGHKHPNNAKEQSQLLQSSVEIAAYVRQQGLQRLRTAFPQPSGSKQDTLIHDADEQRTADLLRTLEPESRRKM